MSFHICLGVRPLKSFLFSSSPSFFFLSFFLPSSLLPILFFSFFFFILMAFFSSKTYIFFLISSISLLRLCFAFALCVLEASHWSSLVITALKFSDNFNICCISKLVCFNCVSHSSWDVPCLLCGELFLLSPRHFEFYVMRFCMLLQHVGIKIKQDFVLAGVIWHCTICQVVVEIHISHLTSVYSQGPWQGASLLLCRGRS